MVKALHPPAPPNGGEGRPNAAATTPARKMIVTVAPEDLAAELLKSPDAKVAAAAKRIFSRQPPTCTKDTANPAAMAAPPRSPTAPVPASPTASASTGEGSVPAEPLPGSNGSAHEFQQDKSSTAQVGVTPAGTTESSSAASALTAMAAAATATFSSGGTATSSPARVAGKKVTSSERLQRSRERNRMHARKTRQRKKEHMQVLQSRADELKNEQLRLRQAINEKNTASILLGMFATLEQKDDAADADAAGSTGPVDPKVEELLKRAPEDIPDASKIPELPALILPGQHNSKKNKEASASSSSAGAAEASSLTPQPQHERAQVPDDGIDYELLGKDRSKCTPAELDHIRRERNRMHAKRTRDRKRIFMEEMEVMIKQLEDENRVLEGHLASLTAGDKPKASALSSAATTPSLAPTSPALQPSTPKIAQPAVIEASTGQAPTQSSSGEQKASEMTPTPTTTEPTAVQATSTAEPKKMQGTGGITVDQIKSILSSAGALDAGRNKELSGILTISTVASAVSAHNSDEEQEHDGSSSDAEERSESESSPRPSKRQCLMASAAVSASC